MRVRDVGRRWLWASGPFQESDAERDDAIVDAISHCADVFTHVIVGMPRLVKFKNRVLQLHSEASKAGMKSVHGRNLWWRPDEGNEWRNAQHDKYPFFEQIIAQIQAEAKMIGDLISGSVVETMVDLENYTTDAPEFQPGRHQVADWSERKKQAVARQCGEAVMFLGRLKLAYPNRGTGDYGLTFSRLTELQWCDPTTYRLKGDNPDHPDGHKETFWSAWIRPSEYTNPKYGEDDQPLAPREVLELGVPKNTTDVGLYCPADTRRDAILELASIW